jgi:two-component system, NarL family, response regulator NreC
MIKILVVDDHPIVRDGLYNAMKNVKDFKIVGAVSSANEALDLIQTNNIDVLLSDISMPEISGIQLAEKVKKISPLVKILFLTMHENDAYVNSAIQTGASGYLLKDSEISELENAIRVIYAGNSYFGKNINTDSNAASQKHTSESEIKPNNILSQREIEILNLIAHGSSNKEIAAKLYISNRTVDAHRYNIMQKLDVKNTAELIKKAVRLKLVEF